MLICLLSIGVCTILVPQRFRRRSSLIWISVLEMFQTPRESPLPPAVLCACPSVISSIFHLTFLVLLDVISKVSDLLSAQRIRAGMDSEQVLGQVKCAPTVGSHLMTEA